MLFSISAQNNHSAVPTGNKNRAFDFVIPQICDTCLLTTSAACLSIYLTSWTAITTDKWVLTILATGYAIEFAYQPPSRFVLTPPSTALLNEIQSLLSKDAISPIILTDHLTGFFSHYFTVPKQDGGLRLIFDLRDLNYYIVSRKVCMVTV